jgi:hypothetical protein
MDDLYPTLQEGSSLGVIFRPEDPAPVGVIMQGDFQRLLGKVVCVRTGGKRTVNLVTDVRFTDDGETYLSFRQRRPA